MDTSEEVYKIVKMIPRGKVSTYGIVAELSGTKNPRTVGHYLHRNPDPGNIPCHRVVNSKGMLTGAFAFGGLRAQEEMLKAEGVEVEDGKVDLGRYLWRG